MAFRHLKTTLQIEHIKKFSLHRILQLTYGCLILYNLASMLRNLVQRPRLFPAREGTKVYCFELAIEFADLFCLAVLYRVRGQLRAMRRRLSAIRQTYFRYAPFRARPRIRRFPISR